MSTQALSSQSMPPIGLIAGSGRLPVHVAQGMLASGRRVACVGLVDQYCDELPALCDRFGSAGIVRIGRWIKLLKKWGVQEAIMVGRVRKATMYQPFRIVRQLPDMRALHLWYSVLRYDKRSDAVLGAVADELEIAGIHLMDSTKFIPEFLADPGVMTRTTPSADQMEDINFALPIIYRMGDLDIGQSIAVKECEIIAVEAIEGTDKMIERAGQLCRNGKWCLVKVPKPEQDLRFDVPCIGLETIVKLKENGATCIAVEAGHVILLDKPNLLKAADEAGVAIVGVERPAGV